MSRKNNWPPGRDGEPVDLARVNFQIHQLASQETRHIEQAFAGHITSVLGRINDGKEATVYLCEAADSDAGEWLAAKVFRARQFRAFNTDRQYRNLSKHRDRRLAKAMQRRSRWGELAFHRHWVESEWDYLNRLYELGVRVPEPVARSDDGILMSFIGDADGAAPRLVNTRLEDEELLACALDLYEQVRVMLQHDVVHGDLSPYNILYHDGSPVIIDVPQAMGLIEIPEAFSMMQRDLSNLDQYFEKRGVCLAFHSLLM